MTTDMPGEGLPIAESLPVPAAAEGAPAAEGGPVAEGEPTEVSPEEEKRRRRKRALLLLLLGLLAMLATIAIWYLLFRQPIPVPLPVIPDTKLPAYATSIYGTTSPMGIAVSPDGNRIYVAETEGDRVVRVFDAAGNQVAVAQPPESTGREHVPVWVAIDPLTEEVYVTDRPTGEIYIYDRNGTYQRTLTLAQPITGWQPVGIAFDKEGLLYVGDVGGGAYPMIRVFDRTATAVRTIGEASKLSFPNGLAVDRDGYVYVADSNNGRLVVFDTEGEVRAQVGRGTGQGNLGLPRGVAVDGNGRVHVADATGQGVFVYRAPTGDDRRLDFVGFVGGEGVADGRFEYPNGVAVDGRGRVYVADTVNDRIQLWSY